MSLILANKKHADQTTLVKAIDSEHSHGITRILLLVYYTQTLLVVKMVVISLDIADDRTNEIFFFS
jgi:hypothetical protein